MLTGCFITTFSGHIWLSTRLLLYARQEVQARRLLERRVGTSRVFHCSPQTGKLLLTSTSPPPSLLEVFSRLQGIAAATSNAEAQDVLIEEARRIVNDISVDHTAAADHFIRDAKLRKAVSADIESECQTLVEYLEVAKRFNLEINSRAKDRVVSFGEKLSCRFMACLLKDRVCFSIHPAAVPVFFVHISLTHLSERRR